MGRPSSSNLKKAILTGSFDPPTLGHLNLIERATQIAPHLTIGIGKSSSKAPLLSIDERVKILRSIIKLDVVVIPGLVADFAQKEKFSMIIRGIRNGSDLDYELSMARINKELCGVETLFLPSELSHIEGRFIRELVVHNGDLSPFLPKEVIKALKNRTTQV